MKHGSHHSAQDLLSDVKSQFDLWRQSRQRGARIPEALWQAAVEAAREYGVSKTAQALSLDYYKLKSRLRSGAEVSRPEPVRGQEFLEIPLFASAADCVLEMQDAEGVRLRVELRGSATAHCATLVQSLWSGLS
jgi:hypothetical protein